MKQLPKRLATFIFLLIWFGVFGLMFVNQQRLIDWYKLRGYTPSPEVAALVTSDAMTAYGQHLLYVNRPIITAGSDFGDACPQGAEKTVVLGCYKGGDEGIWLYKVSDPRLKGVVEVTAAHEMLHAAYARLSGDDKKSIDAQLSDYYARGLTDQRVKETIAAYKKTEPTELLNEMHSIFATEIVSLPTGLETYYKQYFTDRAKVAAYAMRYQSEFTSRQQQVAAFDTQLKDLKQAIEANQASLQSQRSSLNDLQEQMEALKVQGDTAGYNSRVAPYNQAVNKYNALLAETRNQINTYNEVVEKRNTVALEERQLTQALSAQSLPSEQ